MITPCTIHVSSKANPPNCTNPGLVTLSVSNSLSISVAFDGHHISNNPNDLQVYFGPSGSQSSKVFQCLLDTALTHANKLVCNTQNSALGQGPIDSSFACCLLSVAHSAVAC